MKLINKTFIEEKKSKFYGYLFEIDSKEQTNDILNYIKKENKGYRHIPFAYKFINTAGKSNDKEPGNIGLSFLNILERNNLNKHIILVVRYFGGIKLGASTLARVYSKCANECINNIN